MSATKKRAAKPEDEFDPLAMAREALTPSGATKAAYSGEFEFTVDGHGYDAYGEPMPARKITVPWTTVKEIMAAIAARGVVIVSPGSRPRSE